MREPQPCGQAVEDPGDLTMRQMAQWPPSKAKEGHDFRRVLFLATDVKFDPPGLHSNPNRNPAQAVAIGKGGAVPAWPRTVWNHHGIRTMVSVPCRLRHTPLPAGQHEQAVPSQQTPSADTAQPLLHSVGQDRPKPFWLHWQKLP